MLFRMSIVSVSVMLAVLVMANVTLCQTSAFTYQGNLKDGSSAANGTYEMQFALFDASANGNQVGSTITNSSVSVSAGVFTVQLDFGAAAFSGTDRWLEVSVKKPADASFTTLTPRQQINSVPYAVRAANVNATSGDNIVSAINNAATTTTINDSRLPSNIVRLEPSSMQTSNGGNALLNLGSSTSFLKLASDGGFVVSGTANSGVVPVTGDGSRMMWYPGKWAFRAGRVSSFGATYWDESNIGQASAAFGDNTRASGTNSFAAGLATTASGTESVALGNNGTASGDRSLAFNGTATGVGAVAIGSGAQSTTDDAVALGPSSLSSGVASVAIGPCTALGNFATCIGLQTKATASFSTAIGFRVSTASADGLSNFSGVIALGDGSPSFSSQTMFATANNQFNVRAAGGIRFFSACCNYDTGVTVAPGGGSWSSLSDRNMKENFMPVDARDVLRGVLNLPISTWNYKAQASSIRHMGAMAQDFYSTFKIGENDKTIATIDPDGVALAAIQGLYAEIKDRDKTINDLQKQLKQQQTMLDGLRKAMCAQNPQSEICK